MNTILYFAFVLLCGSAIGEDSMLQLDVTNTITAYQHGNYYYSVKGENVSLRCKYSNGQYSIPLNFNKGIRAENASWIYSGGVLRSCPRGKYSEEMKSGRTLLNIYSLSDDDSALYACWYCLKTNTTNTRVLFNFVHLHVLNTNNTPSFCVLHQNTSGIFNPQDDLVLKCPIREGVSLEIRFNDKHGSVKLVRSNLNCKQLDGNFCKINVTKATSILNGTRISCIRSNGNIQFDFCQNIPRLTVIDDMVVHVEVEGGQNGNGRFALLTCASFPSLLSRIQWHVEDRNLMILNNTPKFNQLRIVNRTSPNATKINFEVTCKITIGNISNSTTVNINYTFDSLPTSRGVRTTGPNNMGGLLMTTNVLPLKTRGKSMTGLDVAMSTTQTTNFTSIMAPLSPQSLSSAVIIVPATVLPILVIVFILLLCFFRPSKSATIKRDSRGSGTDNLTRENNYEDTDSRIQLGLSLENSQVAGNVLYEPYRGNNI